MTMEATMSAKRKGVHIWDAGDYSLDANGKKQTRVIVEEMRFYFYMTLSVSANPDRALRQVRQEKSTTQVQKQKRTYRPRGGVGSPPFDS